MNLNEQQLEIVNTQHPNILVIAGPGSGKTRTLIERIIRLQKDGVPGRDMVAITFTNAGAHELQERLIAAGHGIAFAGTLHSYMLRIIRQTNRTAGVLSDGDYEALLEEALTGMKLRDSCSALSAKVMEGPTYTNNNPLTLAAKMVWGRMHKLCLYSFDAILAAGLRLLRDSPPPPRMHYFIDEVQDSAPIDFEIYRALGGTQFLVGDPDQSIFGFRGAAVWEVGKMAKDPKWKTMLLTQNYRCPDNVCRAAQCLVEHNEDRVEKATTGTGIAGDIVFVSSPNAISEIANLALTIQKHPPEQCAVLVRTNAIRKTITEFLASQGIPISAPAIHTNPIGWPMAMAVAAYVCNPQNPHFSDKSASMVLSPGSYKELKDKALREFCSMNQAWHNLSGCQSVDEVIPAILKIVPNLNPACRALIEHRISLAPAGTEPSELPTIIAKGEDLDEMTPGVSVLTMHASKGREWPYVFLPACEQEIIPAGRDIEEERRLFYVAVTRTKSRLWVSHSCSRAPDYGSKAPRPVKASQFIEELLLAKS